MTATDPVTDQQFLLYRYYDGDGNLLYVGITVRPFNP